MSNKLCKPIPGNLICSTEGCQLRNIRVFRVKLLILPLQPPSANNGQSSDYSHVMFGTEDVAIDQSGPGGKHLATHLPALPLQSNIHPAKLTLAGSIPFVSTRR